MIFRWNSVSKLTLDEARKLAARMRNVAQVGGDPSAERKRDTTPPPTFAEATEATHKALAKDWSDRTADAFLASLKEHAQIWRGSYALLVRRSCGIFEQGRAGKQPAGFVKSILAAWRVRSARSRSDQEQKRPPRD